MTDRDYNILPAEHLPKKSLETSDESDEINLRGLLRILWRRRTAIASVVFLLTTLAVIVLFQISPRYTASALVMIDPRDTQIVDIEAVMSGLAGDMETIQSEIEIIKSRGLAEKVIRKTALYNNPEFNARLRPVTFQDSVAGFLRNAATALFSRSDKPVAAREDQFDLERVGIIRAFLRNLEVSRRGHSRVIEIRFESKRPRTAVVIANAIADLYLVEQLEAKFEMTQRATLWLNDRLSELREKVEVTETAVEAYRKQAGLIEGEKASLASQQVSELNTQLVLVRSARAEAEARLRDAEFRLKKRGGVYSVAEVLSSSLIQRLREQEAQLDRKVAELASEYGAKHPRMINARAEMRDLRDKIRIEVGKIVQSFRNEVKVVVASEKSLKESLKMLQQRVAELNSSEVQLRALQREAKANRDLYETFLSRFKETSTQEDMQQIDARIITRADLPSAPSFPNKRMIIALVFVSSIFLGVVLAFAMEHIDHGFRSMEQIERLIGAPALGLVPAVGKSKGAPEKYAVEKPTSMLGEAVRTIYTALVLSNVDTPPRVVLVTSALPKEGKTTTTLLLGRLYAMLGKRAIIIDTDLRRPQVHAKLDLNETPGLVELLTGKATPEEVIQRDEASGADVIVAGTAGPNAAELLSSDRLKSLLSKLGEYYDLVVLDSPPTMAVADARVLAHFADRTILVIRWAATKREIAAMAVKHILDAGGTLAGIVLSRVNIRKHASYGYGDSGYYYGPARRYYGG